jgi:hypothetical protein
MSETTKDFMVVTVRFGPGHVPTPNRKSTPFAILSANLLTVLAISCASLGLWRFGTDLDFARHFVFQNGFLSHWQVWIGLALGVQCTSWRLIGFGRSASGRETKSRRFPSHSPRTGSPYSCPPVHCDPGSGQAPRPKKSLQDFNRPGLRAEV